jgi:hypothetical protein
MNIRKALLGGLVASAAVALTATAAGASTTLPKVPATLISTTTTINNLPDNGGGGTWATDTITRTLKISKAGNLYTAVVSDTGTFTTVPNALTPNQGAPGGGRIIQSVVQGSVTGTASYSFTATRYPAGGLPRVVLALRGSTAENTIPSLFAKAFPAGTSFGPVTSYAWSRTYTANVPKSGKTGHGYTLGCSPLSGSSRDCGYGCKTDKRKHHRCPASSYVQPLNTPASATQTWTDSSSNSEGQLPADGDITGV